MSFKKLLVYLFASLFLFTASCATLGQTDNVTPTQSETPAQTPTQAPTQAPQNAYKGEGIGDSADQPKTWWTNYPRFTNVSDGMKSLDINGDVYSVGADEGRAAYFRTVSYLTSEKSQIDLASSLNLRSSAWIELMGEARAIIGAIQLDENGAYVIDELTGLPKLAATYWSWDGQGPSKNKNVEIVWFGAHSWANGEKWYGDTAMPDGFPLPTYPDGSSALGKQEGKEDSIDPRDYKLYDALAAKSVLGNLMEQEQFAKPFGNDTTGMITDEMFTSGETRYIGDYYFSRDMAAPWWLDFNREAIKAYLSYGTRAFWVDNYTGWGYISNMPIQRAFGDWSVALFREYLKENPVDGIDADSFDIRAYLLDKYEQLTGTPFEIATYTTCASWNKAEFLDDAIWMRYLAFMAKTSEKAQIDFYKMVKEEAQKLGIDPDEVAVTGNDVAGSNYAAMTSDQSIDVVHTEYGIEFSAVTQFRSDGAPPYGNAGGYYKACNEYGRSRRSTIWYYLNGDNEKYSENRGIGFVIAYEALANNCTIYSGDGIPTVAGSNYTFGRVNDFIGKMKDIYGQRDLRAKVGVYHSSASEYATLTPGGYLGAGAVPSTLGYYGWTDILDKLHIPYVTVLEMKCTKEKLDKLDVLIMSNIECVYQSTIDDVIIPFLDSGKTLIVTGENAGLRGGRDDNFDKRSEPALVKLAREYSGNGKVVYMEYDEIVDYYVYFHRDGLEGCEDYTKIVTDIFETLKSEGKYSDELILDGFNGNYITTINYDGDAGRVFIDIANKNIDIETDELTDMNEGTVKVALPQWIQGYSDTMTATGYFAGDNRNENAVATELELVYENGYATVKVPSFKYYASIVINAVE